MAWILVLNPPLLRPIAWFWSSFLGTGTVLVRAHDGAVDHGVFIVRIGRQNLEHLLPHAAPGPAGKSRVKLYRIAEAFRQIPPGNACAIPVKHRLDKQSVVLGSDTDMPFTAGQKVLDTLPLVITKGIAAHSVNSESS